MKLTKNFSLREFTKSQTAERRGIDNSPTDEHLAAIRATAENIAQPVRDHFGPTVITSGYRSQALNKAIGGSQNSQHSKGEAIDFEVIGVSNYEVAKWIKENLVFDQLILEFYTPGDPNSGWVHCSYRADGENRYEVLTAVKNSSGKTEYLLGLKP